MESKLSHFFDHLLQGSYIDSTIASDDPRDYWAKTLVKANRVASITEKLPVFFIGDLCKVPEFKEMAEVYLHLPYSTCIFEFFLSYREHPDRSVCVHPDVGEIHFSGHRVFCYCESVEHLNLPPSASGFIPRFIVRPLEFVRSSKALQIGNKLVDWHIADYGTKFTVGVKPDGTVGISQETLINTTNRDKNPYFNMLMDDIDGENQNFSYGIYAALALMACNNITTEKVSPDKALQRARAKKGKSKMLSYHVLKLKYPKTDTEPKTEAQGTHASPRFHMRRGHIRHHPTAGLVFVAPAAVGVRKNGEVDKDYKLIF